MKKKSLVFFKKVNLVLFLLFPCTLLLLTSCTTSQDDSAYVQMSNPANGLRQGIAPRSSDTQTVDSLIIEIKNLDGRILQSIDTFDLSDTIKLNVPSNITLILTGRAYLDNELLYSGEVTIKPIRAGAGANLTLLLKDLTLTNEKVQIDKIPTSSPGNATKPSIGMSFSRDNDYVLFISNENNLVSNDTNSNADVFIRNLSTNEVTLLHTDNNGVIATASDGISTVDEADISADGLYVVFSSYSNSLVPSNANNSKNVFLKNTATDEISQLSIHELASSTNLDSYNPQISDDGNIITFYSKATIISSASDTVFVVSRNPSQIFPLSIGDVSENYKLSGDGKVIVYQSKNDNNLKIIKILEESNQSLAGALTLNISQTISEENIDYEFSISQDGGYVLFVPKESSGKLIKDQHYLYNSQTDSALLVSRTRTNELFNGTLADATTPAISNDGRYVAFAYDGKTYIRSIVYDNLVEIGDGIHPFLSSTGDKIGFEFENNLYFLNNPLYLEENATVAKKALAPGNFQLQEGDGFLTLTWNSIADASFYRIYQSEQPNIATKIGTSAFSTIIYETTNTTFAKIYPSNFDYSNFYFVVYAVDKNGEGIASSERFYTTNIGTMPNRSSEGTLESPFPITLPYFLGATEDDVSVYTFSVVQPGNSRRGYKISVLLDDINANSDRPIINLFDTNASTEIECVLPGSCTVIGIVNSTKLTLVVDGDNNDDFYFSILLTELTNELNVSTSLDRSNNNIASTTNPIKIYFSETVITSSVSESIELRDSSLNFIPTTSTVNNLTALVQPNTDLIEGENYTFTINTSLMDRFEDNLSTAYTANFVARRFFNEGSRGNPLKIELPYSGSVDAGVSVYRLTLPPAPANQSYAIKLTKTDGGAMSVPMSLNNITTGRYADCSSIKETCIVSDLADSTDFILTINQTSRNVAKKFDIKLVPILSLDTMATRSSYIQYTGGSGLIFLTGLQVNTNYHFSDLTDLGLVINYRLNSKLVASPECLIQTDPDSRIFQNDCVVTSNSAGEILLELTATTGTQMSNIERRFRLDYILSEPFNIGMISNKVFFADERIIELTGFDSMKTYYLALKTIADDATYHVSSNLFFNQNSTEIRCTGKINPSTNDLDSCVFKPSADGKIVLHMDSIVNLAADTDHFSVEAFELLPSDIVTLNPGDTVLPNNRLMFANTDLVEYQGTWLNVTIEFPLPSSGSMTIYNDLNSLHTCKTDLLESFTACEMPNDPNNTPHIIAFEFSQESVDYASDSANTQMRVNFNSIINPRSVGNQTGLGYLDYFNVSTTSVGNIRQPYYMVKNYLQQGAGDSHIFHDMHVFNGNSWSNEICTPVVVQANQLCITDQFIVKDIVNFKLAEYRDFPEAFYRADILLEAPKIQSPSMQLNNNFGDTTDKYELYFVGILLLGATVEVTVTNLNLATSIPFSVVSTDSNFLICRSTESTQNSQMQSCSSNTYRRKAFIVLDTSTIMNSSDYTISVFPEVAQPPPP